MTAKERRTVFVGLGIIGVAVMGGRVIPKTVSAIRRIESAAYVQRELLARARRELAGRADVADSLEEMQEVMVDVARGALQGASEREATLDLTSRVTFAAGRSGVRLQRMDHLPDTARFGLLGRVRALVEVETDVRGLADLLREIEGDEALIVDDFRVESQDPTADSARPEVLLVALVVRGWWVGSETDAGDGAVEPATTAGGGGGGGGGGD